jgi:RNA-directed DNA polymerase
VPEDAPVNIGAMLLTPFRAGRRVLAMQSKLHSWAAADPGRRFDDLYNLVADPAFMVTAWMRVRENKGARTAGIDKRTARSIEASAGGVEAFLEDLRGQLKTRTFRPLPVRQRKIPKANGKLRSLGIPTVADRVVQACLKLVLEPILEIDFTSSSYGFRPARRAQDAVEDIRHHAHRGYEWVFEGDIAACFDEISHPVLMDRLRRRVGDRRVLALVKSFLTSGLLDEDGIDHHTTSGTPQGGILSPLLANLALSVLDEHFQQEWDQHGTSTDRTDTGNEVARPIAWCDMPTTSSCWSTGPGTMSVRYGRRSKACWERLDSAWPWRRPASRTSTRDSTSSGSASSGTSSGEVVAALSTPTRPRSRWRLRGAR